MGLKRKSGGMMESAEKGRAVVSCGYSNQSPQAGGLKPQMYILSLFRRPEVQSGVSAGTVPYGGSERESAGPLPHVQSW